ncbi:MAG: type III PLP-dependent enzyme [Alphaproteobacteria bacterium]
MTEKIARFLVEHKPETPCLVVDLDVVAENYARLCRLLPLAQIYYAVKANPAPEILKLLVELGSNFDSASVFEVEECVRAGVKPERISFSNTIKKERDIARAYELGVRLFAFDSEAELEKLATAAPGSHVYCRLLISNEGADWPLSEKFGCEIEMARNLLVKARDLGLDPYGVAFHVGSQQRDVSKWDIAIGRTAMLFSALNEVGIELKMLNLGGGFPAHYRTEAPPLDDYARAIMNALTRHFGNKLPDLMVEPGRIMTGDAGIIQAEVVLISRKSYDEDRRWVYLDIGKFGGLVETIGECIRYRIRTPKDGGPVGPVVLAGPTCDGEDVLYDKADYKLPLGLDVGDKIEILSTGAYTTTYCSVGFNGFPPLKAYYI